MITKIECNWRTTQCCESVFDEYEVGVDGIVRIDDFTDEIFPRCVVYYSDGSSVAVGNLNKIYFKEQT